MKARRTPANYHDLRALAWRLQGIGALLRGLRPDVALTEDEAYGLGSVISELGESVETVAAEIETAEIRAVNRRKDSVNDG